MLSLLNKTLTQLLLDRIQPRYISSFARRSVLHTTMVLVSSPEPCYQLQEEPNSIAAGSYKADGTSLSYSKDRNVCPAR